MIICAAMFQVQRSIVYHGLIHWGHVYLYIGFMVVAGGFHIATNYTAVLC
jgi:hypothetical protein